MSSRPFTAIGIDVGGTKIAAGAGGDLSAPHINTDSRKWPTAHYLSFNSAQLDRGPAPGCRLRCNHNSLRHNGSLVSGLFFRTLQIRGARPESSPDRPERP